MPERDRRQFDAVVVGAGPGGIAAAVTLSEAGRRVALVDDSPLAGGQIWRNRGERPSLPGARAWLDRLDAAKTVTRIQQARVVATLDDRKLLVEQGDATLVLQYDALVLATGARELFLPFPGWTMPGVFGAGAIQALVKTGLLVKGKRIVIAGTGPLLLAVADLMRDKGAIVPMILEQALAAKINRFGISLWRSPGKLAAGVGLRARLLFGTRYATGGYPLRVSQADNALRLDYRTAAGEASIDCDYVACGFNLIPNNELARVMECATDEHGFVRVDARSRTSVPNVYAIGELTGIGGVEKAILEGRVAAHAIAGDEAAVAGLARPHLAALAFARRLDEAFALRPEVLSIATPDCIVCRCEDVKLAAVRNSMNARDAKLQTRCGMGPCQGRVCGPALQRLLGKEPAQVRPPVFTTSIRTLAAAAKAEQRATAAAAASD